LFLQQFRPSSAALTGETSSPVTLLAAGPSISSATPTAESSGAIDLSTIFLIISSSSSYFVKSATIYRADSL
jgi:hypothetical protein